mgnify:FL=1
MAQKRELEITVSPEGEVSVKVKGIAGSGCLAATKFLEDVLGGEVASREHTDEYYQQSAVSDAVRTGG